MKVKRVSVLVSGLFLAITLYLGHPSALAAPSAGEVKIMGPMMGNQIPIPRLELGHANDYMQMLYDPLVGTTPDGQLSTKDGIAWKWEMTPDGLTWTFYLRKGIKFHNDVELTASDVKFSLEQQMLRDAKTSYAGEMRRTIGSIEVKDPYTVVIRCKKPSIFLGDILSNKSSSTGLIIPKNYYEKVGQDPFIRHPVGSGPYKWRSQMVGTDIRLEAVDKHWLYGVPRYKYFTFLVIPEESTQIAMLKTGEGDIARISRANAKDVLNAGLNVILKENAYQIYFAANMQWTSPVFSDIRFRKALNLAIDKEGIMKHILAGMATPYAIYPGRNALTCGADPALKPYPYDPQEAKRLIKEAGYEGYEFDVPNMKRAGVPEMVNVVEAVAGFWQKIGLKPKIFMTDYPAYRERRNARKVQNIVHGFDSTSDAGCGDLMDRFANNYYSKEEWAIVQSKYLDERFDKIYRSLDIAEVARLAGEITRYAYDQYLLVPICEVPDVIATTKRVPKWNPGTRRLDRNYYDLIRER